VRYIFDESANRSPRKIATRYAQDHTGVCLKFERVRDYRVMLHALPVVYQEDLRVVNWLDAANAIVEMLFRKHPDWKYERESRLLLMGQAGRYLPMRPEAVTGIVFGYRATEDARAIVTSLLAERAARGYPPICIYDAIQHSSKYRLVIQKGQI
jgi:DUF2971 family protein